MITALTHLQHVRDKHVIYVAILEEKTDDFNRRYYQLQLEGAKTALELPGVLDEVITLAVLKDDEGGSRSVEIQKKVRPWWFPTETGKIALSIRYGARVVEISKGKSAIEVASGDDLINALVLVKKAVEAGELDPQIESASIKLREGFGK